MRCPLKMAGVLAGGMNVSPLHDIVGSDRSVVCDDAVDHPVSDKTKKCAWWNVDKAACSMHVLATRAQDV